MKALALSAAVIVSSAVAATSAHAAQTQPPMNNFNFAFYNCDNGGAFQVNYPSKKPDEATLVTSNNSKQYELKRSKVASGVAFEGDGAKFSVDGASVEVTGTEVALQNCKMKP